MTKIDPMTVATRFFNTPLLIEPRKAVIIAQAFGGRFLGLKDQDGLQVEAVGLAEMDRHDRARREEPRAGALIADGLFRRAKRDQMYSIVSGVAIIPIVGSLVRRGSYIGQSSGVTSYEGISAQIRAAAEDPEVRGIALEMDSFGGEAHGAFDLARQIRAAGQVKPVRAFLSEFALSAGYLLASQAERITVPRFGDAGSIGVVMMHVDYKEHLENEGVRVSLIHSGAHKVDGNPFDRLPAEVRGEMQALSDEMRAQFANEVAAGRGGRLDFDGAMGTEAGILRGTAAVRAGLADEVAEARDAFNQFVEDMTPAAPRAAGAMAGSAPSAFVRALEGVTASISPAAAMSAPGNAYQAVPEGASGLTSGGGSRITGAEAPISKEADMSKKHVDAPEAENSPVTTAEAPDTGGGAAETKPEGHGPDAAEITRQATERAVTITRKVEAAGLPASLATELIASGDTLEVCFGKIIDAKASDSEDGGDIHNARASITGDGRDRTREGMTKAILGRVRLDGGERNEFSSMSLKEMARTSLTAQGIAIPKGGSLQLVGAAFVPSMASGMHSTSDFAEILADVANKSMLKGFSEVDETFERFTSVGTLTDFKPTRRVGVDEFPALLEVQQGAEFKYGSIADHAETAILATYGRLFAITRQGIINDDMDQFSKIPEKMGRAARRTVGDLVFAVLTGNPAMSDGDALFHANHSNLAAAGGAPSEASFNAAITAMATQKDRSANATALNIAPAFGIFPPALRSVVLQTLNSEYAPDDTAKSGTSKQPRAYNTVRDAVEPIFDARLTGTAWYMTADPGQHDVIEVGYLDGDSQPFLDQQDGWSVDGVEFKVRIDACATPLAYQTLYKDPGA